MKQDFLVNKRKILYTMVSGKLPPEKFLPIKLPPDEFLSEKLPPRKFPPWRYPPMVLNILTWVFWFFLFFHYHHRYCRYYFKDCFVILYFKSAEVRLVAVYQKFFSLPARMPSNQFRNHLRNKKYFLRKGNLDWRSHLCNIHQSIFRKSTTKWYAQCLAQAVKAWNLIL